jgi:hypothetical protein
MRDYIYQFEAFGGKFNEEIKEIVMNGINLTSDNIEMFCNGLINGFDILSLVLDKCSLDEKDLDKLLNIIINRSSVRRLLIINVEIRKLFGLFKYVCRHMEIYINNQSLKIQFIDRLQDGDIKFLVRLGMQNKVCRTFSLSGCDFYGRGKELCRCFQSNQESVLLDIKHVNNIEFLCDILNQRSSINSLKLSFWLSSPLTLSRFCDVLKTNSTLVELHIIDHHCFDDEHFTIKLLNILHDHKSIKRLTLHLYNVKPLKQKETCLIDALLHRSFISRLHFSQSIISHQLIQALIHSSQKNHSLTHLEFYDCQINDDDIANLQLLYINANLTHLKFSKESYWLVAVAEMRRQLQYGKYFTTNKLP